MGRLTNWRIFIKKGRVKMKIFEFLTCFLYKFCEIFKKVELYFVEGMNDVVLGTISVTHGH